MDFILLLKRENAKSAPPPPGVTPNFANPDSNGTMYMAGTLTTLGFASICVVLRLVTKTTMNGRRLGWDDFLILFALFFSIARATCFIVDIYHYGIAHHVWDLKLPFPRNLWLLHRIADIMWPPGMLCAKLSILMYYKAIFGSNNKFRWAVYGVAALNTAYLGATTLVHIFWCSPVGAAYGIKYPGVKTICIDGYKTDLAIGALNLLTDLIILVLPMPMLYMLRLTKVRKLGLAAIFSIGAFTVASTVAREAEIALRLKNSETDQTWVVMYEAVWISVELNVAIIASCLLVCPQLFRYVLRDTAFGHSVQSLLGRGSHTSASQTPASTFRPSPFSKSRPYKKTESENSLELGNFKNDNSVKVDAGSFLASRSDGEVPEGVIKQTKTFSAV